MNPFERGPEPLAARLRRRGLAGLLTLLAAALAGCDGAPSAPPLEEPAEYSTIAEPIAVLRVDDNDGVLAYATITHRGNDQQASWVVADGAELRKRYDGDPALARGLAANAGDDTLWTVVEDGAQLQLCMEVPVLFGIRRCLAPAMTPRSQPRALATDHRGSVVLLARRVEVDGTLTSWQTLWMRSEITATEQVQDITQLLGPTADPVLVHGPDAARLFWVKDGELTVAVLDTPELRWRREYGLLEAPDVRWTVAQENGGARRSWFLRCTGNSALADRIEPGGWISRPRPPLPPCGRIVAGTLQMAASGNGDALLIWAEPAAGNGRAWSSTRWTEAEGRWAAAEPLAAGPDGPQQLVADGAGRFALVREARRDDQSRVSVDVLRPGEGWQAPLDLGPKVPGGPLTVGAGGDGHALLAWSVPAATDRGNRLATERVDLRRAYVQLGVEVAGDGRVRSTPNGINCPGSCSASYPPGTEVRLEAQAGPGQRMLGWSGSGCSGLSAIQTLTLNAAQQCRVSFGPENLPTLTLAVQGGGRLAADPPGPSYAPGSAVRLIATPDVGQRLVSFGGDGDCVDGLLTMDGSRSCSARFEADPALVRVAVAVTGPGRVRSVPAGIDCTATCSHYFDAAIAVTLSAEPAPGHAVAWSGAAGCTGTALVVSPRPVSGTIDCSASFQRLAPVNEWRMLGAGAPAVAAAAGRPSIAADAAGVPTLAYLNEVADFRQVVVKRLVGDAWVPLGGGALSIGLQSANAPSLALDASGQPVVAFTDSAARLRVRRWDGSSWVALSDALAVTPGAVTSAPQAAISGNTLVVAWNEFQGNTARLALQRYDLAAAGPWTGGYVPEVGSSNELDLRLALRADGRATLLYQRSGSGTAGELPLRAVQETATGWAAVCGDLGTGPGLRYSHAALGIGVQHAADGSVVAAEVGERFDSVQAWRCDGTDWLPWGPDGGRVLAVDNNQLYLVGLAVSGGSGPAMLAVQVNTGYALGTRLHAFSVGANGFEAIGPPLDVPLPGRGGALAVAPAAPGSPVVAFGVNSGANQALQGYRFHP